MDVRRLLQQLSLVLCKDGEAEFYVDKYYVVDDQTCWAGQLII